MSQGLTWQEEDTTTMPVSLTDEIQFTEPPSSSLDPRLRFRVMKKPWNLMWIYILVATCTRQYSCLCYNHYHPGYYVFESLSKTITSQTWHL